MPKLNWNGNDFRNSQDSPGTVADNISRNGNLQQGYNHGSLTKGLIAYYPMEKGEGEVLHDGAFDNIGQIKGANWNGNGQVGNQSLNFDASSVDKVNLNEIDKFIEPPISISFWIRPDSMGDQVIFDHDGRLTISTGTPPTGTTGNDEIGFGIYDGSSWNNILSSSKSSGSWYHIVSLYDGTDMRLYVNGSKVGTNTSSKLDTKDEGTELGARGTKDPYNGLIDDFRVYDRMLSEPEIQALYNLSNSSGIKETESSVPGQSEGGISRYKLNGTADDAWDDNNGTNNGADLTATGVYGQAAKFNGTDNYIKIGVPSELDFTASDDFAISCWINSEDLSSDRHHIISTRSSSNNWLFIGTYTDGSLEFRCAGDSNANAVRHQIDIGNWYHVLGVYNSNDNSVKLYINGSLVGEDSSSTISGSFLGGDDWEIGRRQNSSYRRWYNGKIDDVRIYDKALTPLQVEKLYHKGAYRISRESTLQ